MHAKVFLFGERLQEPDDRESLIGQLSMVDMGRCRVTQE